ncbi:MAG: YvcK family protein [Acidobacteria bacterium]|nr:MAG: YvcK family protein [Acidobacteriota bacterium]
MIRASSKTEDMNIVGIGGGTGLPVLLRGLKQLRDRSVDGNASDSFSVTALVCVSDNGGSSGSLRQALDIPAVGDLRNCLVALAEGNPALRDIFQYRLRGESGLDGHCLGNLIVSALCARSGNLQQAVHLAAEILQSQGRVLPSTEVSATLCAESENGAIERGETQITARRMKIRRVWLEPPNTPPAPGVLETLASADAIVLGPGSLYTSVIANLLPTGVADAVRNSPALKILVCNLMTQAGETDGYSASDHVRAVQQYLGREGVHICLLNSTPISEDLEAKYARAGTMPVCGDLEEISLRGVVPICLDLLGGGADGVRHDPGKLARWIVGLTRAFLRARDLRFGDVRCFVESDAANAGAEGVWTPSDLPAL